MNIKKFSSIRSKIVLIIAASIVALSVLIYFISINLLLQSYHQIEVDQTFQNVDRAHDAVTNVVSQLNVKLTDWAWWDDSYKFMEDKNKGYIESNLGIGSISNLKINTMVFVDTSGSIVFKKMIDFTAKKELSADSIGAYVNAHSMFTLTKMDSNIKGIILLPEGSMIVAALPILTSDALGPLQGTLIFGKFLDKDMVGTIGDLTHLSVSLYPYDALSLPTDVLEAKAQLSNNGQIVTLPLSDKSIGGYTVLYDIYANPTMLLKVETPREIYNQGLRTFYSFMLIASIAILLFGLLIIFLIERFFTSRFSKLSQKVQHIGETTNFKERIPDSKKDEFGTLSSVINKMLDTLCIALEAGKQASRQAVLNEKELNERMQELETLNKLMVGRELKMVELKKEISDLKEKPSITN